jgi:hypothetical protein
MKDDDNFDFVVVVVVERLAYLGYSNRDIPTNTNGRIMTIMDKINRPFCCCCCKFRLLLSDMMIG